MIRALFRDCGIGQVNHHDSVVYGIQLSEAWRHPGTMILHGPWMALIEDRKNQLREIICFFSMESLRLSMAWTTT